MRWHAAYWFGGEEVELVLYEYVVLTLHNRKSSPDFCKATLCSSRKAFVSFKSPTATVLVVHSTI